MEIEVKQSTVSFGNEIRNKSQKLSGIIVNSY